MIVFRIALLVVVAYLGAVIFYSRRNLEPGPLLRYAVGRAAVACLWTVGAFILMTLIEWAFINSH